MLSADYYDALREQALADERLSPEACEQMLVDPEVDTLSLVAAAYPVRLRHWAKDVQIHIINNAQNGLCPEDCAYCTQAKTSTTDIETYPIKSDEEILDEARRAHEAGAHRYCMVFAGRGPNVGRTRRLADLVRTIKSAYDIEVCVSAGLLDGDKAAELKAAGLDRYNHNLNTSREHYGEICTTHTYEDRLNTLRAARGSGLEVCSGMIVGMGESSAEVVEVAQSLRALDAASIPVNFLLPFDGTPIGTPVPLTPDYCLRVLCMFRLLNPRAEVRIAAGRELHLRSLQPIALQVANSIFLEGYLNSRGDAARTTLNMLRDAGYRIVSDYDLDSLLEGDALEDAGRQQKLVQLNTLKDRGDLRPTLG